MIDGLRSGIEGLRLMSLKLDTAASNIANVSTTGYKKDEVAAGLPAADSAEVIKTSGYIDLSQGELVKTDNPFDLALEGEGFFVAGEGGKTGFTRDGRFSLDAGGRLVTAGGLPVQGKSGPITVNPTLAAVINSDGTLMQGGNVVDKIKVVKFLKPGALQKSGGGLLTGTEAGTEAAAAVRQGFVESSNVKMIEEMASLMQVMRNFDSIQKGITSQDMATGKLIAAMGRF
jgi:flagellar basal-body rod protein FlgF